MSPDAGPKKPSDGIRRFPGPPLVLRMPRVDGPSYVELESGAPPWSDPPHQGHPLYGLAAFVYHHADRMSSDQRRGFFIALEVAWPRTQGDRKEQEYRALTAWRAARGGIPVSEIANEFGVKPDTAERWIRAVDRELDSTRPPESADPRVEVAWADDGENPEPDDPADLRVYARWLVRSPDELRRQLEDEGRLERLQSRSASHQGER
jgi:transposase-like protein